MTISAATFLTFSLIGNREDLVDQIYNISPFDTPFQSKIGKVKATAVLHEWQLDSLAAAATQAQLEGDDLVLSSGISSATVTTRLGNTAQILYKTVQVSGTADAINKAGRKKEIVYQLMKRSRELRRDIEKNLMEKYVKNSGNSTTPRTMTTLRNWYSSNSSIGGGTAANSTNSGVTSAIDSSVLRVLNETMVKSVIQSAWAAGGHPEDIMVGPFNKTQVSAFVGNNTRVQDTSDGTLKSAISVYGSDFGTHRVSPNKFQRERDVHILDVDLWAVAALRTMQTIDLAKTGDAERGMLIWEGTLEARNEAGSGIVADLTTS